MQKLGLVFCLNRIHGRGKTSNDFMSNYQVFIIGIRRFRMLNKVYENY